MADLDTYKTVLDVDIATGLNTVDGFRLVASSLLLRAAIASIQQTPGSGGSSAPVFATTVTETITPVTTSSSVILAANPSRKDALIINMGTVDVFLSRSGTSVLNQGIILKAGGSVYEINSTNLYRGAISAIASAATSLLVSEGI